MGSMSPAKKSRGIKRKANSAEMDIMAPGVNIFPQNHIPPHPFKMIFFPQVGTVQIGGKYIIFPPLSIRFCHNSSLICFFLLFPLYSPSFLFPFIIFLHAGLGSRLRF